MLPGLCAQLICLLLTCLVHAIKLGADFLVLLREFIYPAVLVYQLVVECGGFVSEDKYTKPEAPRLFVLEYKVCLMHRASKFQIQLVDRIRSLFKRVLVIARRYSSVRS